MNRLLKKLNLSAKEHSTTPPVPNAVQLVASNAAPPTPKLLEPQERGQQQPQIAELAEDLTGLSELWPLRDSIAKDNTKIESVSPYHRPCMYTTSKAET